MTNALSRRGFTLIELLVVIAIIGVLSSVVLASLNSARTKARDAQRISNVKSLKTAMELYYTTNNTYPTLGCQDCGAAAAGLSSYLTPTHIPSIPADPQGLINYYVWGNGGNAYGLYIYTEATGAWCVTGVNINPGWWEYPAQCNF